MAEMMKKRRALTALVLLLLTCGGSAIANDRHAILFILDGTPMKFLYENVQNGSLPTLKEYFWDNGAHVNAGVTTFPSQSASAYQSFITGLFAGRSGIPYLQWYDRVNQREIDYLGLDYNKTNKHMWNYHAVLDPDIEGVDYPVTVMERLKGEPTSTLYSEIKRGATDIHPKFVLPPLIDTFLINRQDMLDRRPLDMVLKLYKKKRREVPRFTLVGLYAADVFQHKESAGSENARYALIQFDIFLKEFIELLKKRGLFDRTYIMVVADHGMHDIEHNVDVAPALKKAGLRPMIGSLKGKKADYFLSERGVASAHLYMKGDDPSKGSDKQLEGRPTLEKLMRYPVGDSKSVDVIELLRKEEGVGLIVARNGNNKVEVYSKDCHATITKIDVMGRTYFGYKKNSCDPLDYCDLRSVKEMCGGSLYDDRKWLARTWDMHYPDGVVQLGQLFDDGRAGDIFIVADQKGTFYKEKAATHGSLIDEDMQVPILIHGPGVPKGEFGPVRTVDMYPTLLDWFDLADDGNHDGIKFWAKQLERSREARSGSELANMEAFLLDAENIDDVRSDFQVRFARQMVSGEIREMIEAELKRRGASLAKLERLLPSLSRRDLELALVTEQLNRIKNDIRRLEDVKILVQ